MPGSREGGEPYVVLAPDFVGGTAEPQARMKEREHREPLLKRIAYRSSIPEFCADAAAGREPTAMAFCWNSSEWPQ